MSGIASPDDSTGNGEIIIIVVQQRTLFNGNAGTSQQFQYAGSGTWQPVSVAAVAAGNLTGTLTAAQLPGNVLTNGASGVSLSGTFTGNGSGLTNLAYANLTGAPAIPSTNGFVTAAITNGLATTNFVLAQGYLNSANGGNAALATNVVAGLSITNAFITNSVFAGDGGGLTNLNAAQLTGTIPLARLPASVLTNNASGVSLSGSFTGNGSSLTNLSFTHLTDAILQSQLPPTLLHNNQLGVQLQGYFSGAISGTFTGDGSGLTKLPANVLTNGSGATGAYSTALGVNTTASGTSSTAMGGGTTAYGNDSIAMGVGTTASGNTSTAMGTYAQAVNDFSFVWSDYQGGMMGPSYFASTANNQFSVRASGGVRFVTGGTGMTLDGQRVLTNGASGVSLTGTFVSVSDRNVKKDFAPVDSVGILEKLAAMPVTQWHYQWEDAGVTPHIGPMAQDFKAAFYPGTDDKSITTLEFDGVELAAIKGLNEKVDSEVSALRAGNAELKQQNDALAQKLDALEKLVQTLIENQ